jgi:hypothetical protein
VNFLSAGAAGLAALARGTSDSIADALAGRAGTGRSGIAFEVGAALALARRAEEATRATSTASTTAGRIGQQIAATGGRLAAGLVGTARVTAIARANVDIRTRNTTASLT